MSCTCHRVGDCTASPFLGAVMERREAAWFLGYSLVPLLALNAELGTLGVWRAVGVGNLCRCARRRGSARTA